MVMPVLYVVVALRAALPLVLPLPTVVAVLASIFIVLDEATRHERLIARHVAFGKTPDAARAWALGPDERNAAAIAATLERADYLLDTSANDSSAGSSTR